MTPSESAFVAAPIAVNVEALRCLGVDGDRIMTADAESPLRARRAIVIQNFAQPFGPHTISARVAAAIRSRLTPGMAAKRIYIDRRTAVRRRCTNESKLIERLEGLGFRPVALERLSFTEQAALFSAAEMVVAPHGAGLAHVMFAPPGVKVLEIVTNLWSPDMLIRLASASEVGGHWWTVMFPARRFGPSDHVHIEYEVDVDAIAAIVDELIRA